MAVQSGRLEPLKLFKVFRSMLDRRMSGVLTVKRDSVVKKVHVVHGYAVRVASNLPQEALGWALVQEGLISSTEYQEVEAERQTRQQSLEAVVLGRNLVAAQRLKAVEHRLGRRRLLDTFTWSDGTFVFELAELRTEPGVEVIDTVPLLMEAAARTLGGDLCDRFVSAYRGRVITTEWIHRYGESFDALFPPPNIRSLLGRPIAFDDIAMRMADRGAAARQLAALVLGGLTTFQAPAAAGVASTTGPMGEVKVIRSPAVPPRTPPTESRPSSAPGPVAPARPVRPPEVSTGAPRGAPPSAPPVTARVAPSSAPPPVIRTAPPSAPPPVMRPGADAARAFGDGDGLQSPPTLEPASRPPDAASSRAGRTRAAGTAQGGGPVEMPDKMRNLLVEARALAPLLEGPDRKTHYEVLGVAVTADEAAMRTAFRSKARDFHADRFARYDIDEADATAIQLVFIEVNRANEVLTDPAQRREYDLQLEEGRRAKAAGRSAPSSGSGVDMKAHLKAEALIKNGVQLLKNGNAQAAFERFDEALQVATDDPIGVAGRAFAELQIVLARGGLAPQLLARTRETLEDICGKFEKLDTPFLYLGMVYRMGDQLEKAEEALRRALTINPHNDQAASELRFLKRRTGQSGQQKGIKGLFGRKKT